MSHSCYRPDSHRLLVVAALSLVAGCQRDKPTPPPPPPAEVTVARSVWREVQNAREYTGYLEPVETANIRTRVRGFLKKIHFKEGAEVKKGDLLYEIDPREFEANVARAQADLTKANAALARAQADEDRARGLLASKAISEEEFAQRVADRKSAQATVTQAEAALRIAKLDLEFTKIHSPIDGRISRTMVTEGNLVGFNEPTLLTTIVRVDPVYVVFDVPEAVAVESEKLSRQQSLPSATDRTIPIQVAVARETDHQHPGVIDFRENRVDTGTGTIRLRAVLNNDDRLLIPGLFARVRVPLGNPQRLLSIPEVALMTDQAGRYVFVVDAEDVVRRQNVTIGGRVGSLVGIEKGLNPDDWVIINGVQKARPTGKVAPKQVDLDPPKQKGPEKK